MSEEEQRRRGIDRLAAELTVIRRTLVDLVDRLDHIRNLWSNMSPKEETMLNIPPEELDRLPWTKYPRCLFGEWILAKDAPTLGEALAREPTKSLTIAGCDYRFQGKGDKFIARWPMPLRFRKKMKTVVKSER